MKVHYNCWETPTSFFNIQPMFLDHRQLECMGEECSLCGQTELPGSNPASPLNNYDFEQLIS